MPLTYVVSEGQIEENYRKINILIISTNSVPWCVLIKCKVLIFNNNVFQSVPGAPGVPVEHRGNKKSPGN